VIGGDLDHDYPDAVRVLDPHLGQPPGLGDWLPDDRDAGRGQPGVLGVNIPYLDPDHHRTPRMARRMPGDLEQCLAEEEHDPRIFRRTELAVNGQAQYVTIEAATPVQVGRPQQDPAAQNVHVTISALQDSASAGRPARAVHPAEPAGHPTPGNPGELRSN
jgi:hypothetical protein